MNLEMITEGLKQLLQENNYSSATIRFYEGEWNKIQCFLTEEYGNTEYDMEQGLKYLEKQYGFITKYNNETLSQQRVQGCALRAALNQLPSGVPVKDGRNCTDTAAGGRGLSHPSRNSGKCNWQANDRGCRGSQYIFSPASIPENTRPPGLDDPCSGQTNHQAGTGDRPL